MPTAPEPPTARRPDDREFRALAVLVAILALLTIHTVRSLVAPLILAAWFAALSAPLVDRVSRRLGGRKWVGAVTTLLLVLLIVVPVALIAIPLANMIAEAIDTFAHAPPQNWMRQLANMATEAPRGAAQHGDGTLRRVVALAQSAGPAAATFVSHAFGAASKIVVQLFVLAIASYYFASDGRRIIARIEQGTPLSHTHFRALLATFLQVARAMLVGELLTAVAQGVVAGVIYAILRVPNALFFAVLTGFVSLLPSVGSALVWVPLCGVLIAAGRAREAIILGVAGVAVIGTIDNVLRPFFSRFGANQIQPLPLLVGIFGGIEAFGGWGLILGPLVVSLFLSAYKLYADERVARRAVVAG